MKKLLALLIALTMIIGLMPVVSAAIPQNSGLGTALTFSQIERNAPSSGNYYQITVVEDETFGTVSRYWAKNNYTNYKFQIVFEQNDNVTVTAGDKAFISFYYRVNVIDGEAYQPITNFQHSKYACLNPSQTAQWQSHNAESDLTTNEWHYVSFVTDVYANSTNGLREFVRFFVSTNTTQALVDIADPKAVYMGAVTDEDDATANEQIVSALSTTAITGITAGETAIDLTANPTSYTTTEQLTAENITVTTRYGSADKVVIETAESGETMTIKVYAPYVDWTSTDATPSATYTINMEKAEEPYVTITENNGYGTGVVLGTDSPSIEGRAGKDYIRLDTIKGEAAAPFDEYYSWTREAFEVDAEGANNQSYLAFSGDLSGGANKGDWVYVSFYYRTYNRFTNSEGQVVDNNQMDLYPSIRSNSLENKYYRPGSTAQHIRLTPDTTAENDVGEWKKLTYIQKLENATNESWTLKLSNTHTSNTANGTIVGTNRKIDFADIKVVYFGTPETNTDDEDIIKAAIEEAAGNYGLTKVYINGEEIDINSNPLRYNVVAPRYSAGVDSFTVTADSIHGAGLVNVFEDDNTYVVKSYPLDYDYLSGTDTRVATYTINSVPEYDFYDFALNGLTLSLKGDNGLNEPKSGIIIGASYDAGGKMLKLKAEPFTLADNSTANALSVTVPDADGVESLKFFIWDGIATSVPYVKTIIVNDVTTGTITQ